MFLSSARRRRLSVLLVVLTALVGSLAFAAGSGASRPASTSSKTTTYKVPMWAGIQGDAIPGVDVSIEQTPSGIILTHSGATGVILVVKTHLAAKVGASPLSTTSSNNYNSSKSNSAGITFTAQSTEQRTAGIFGQLTQLPVELGCCTKLVDLTNSSPKEMAFRCQAAAPPALVLSCSRSNWILPVKGVPPFAHGKAPGGWTSVKSPAVANDAVVAGEGGAQIVQLYWLVNGVPSGAPITFAG